MFKVLVCVQRRGPAAEIYTKRKNNPTEVHRNISELFGGEQRPLKCLHDLYQQVRKGYIPWRLVI